MWSHSTRLKSLTRILIASAFLVVSALQGQTVEDLLVLVAQGELDSARAVITELSYEHPGHPGVAYARALMETDALIAAGIYKDILRNHPGTAYYPGSLMRMGEYYYAQGLYVQSRKYFMELIREYPTFPQVHLAVNMVLRAGIAARQMDSVYVDLSTILQTFPNRSFDFPEELDLTRIDRRRPNPLRDADVTPPAPGPAPVRTLGADLQSEATPTRSNYSLQAGAFSAYKNARRQADQIESIGYSTRIEDAVRNGKTLYLIKVGDYIDRTAALSAADMLEAALGISAFPVSNH